MEIIRPIYEEPGEFLAVFNMRLILALATYLGLSPRFHPASTLSIGSTSTCRLIDIVRRLGGTSYVSGAGGRSYQNPAAFVSNGIDLNVQTYQPLPYTRREGPFVSGLSVLDAVFHLGKDASQLLEYPRALVQSARVAPEGQTF